MITKVNVTCEILKGQSFRVLEPIKDIEYVECDYKQNNIPPMNGWEPFVNGSCIKGADKHFWFKLRFNTPKTSDNQRVVLDTLTVFDKNPWYLSKPQSMIFVDGKTIQALDPNHTQMRLESDKHYEIFIYFFVGSKGEASEFNIRLGLIEEPVRQLYYDMFVPMQACRDIYYENSYEYSQTIKILNKACNMLALNYPYTEEYYKGIADARKFLKEEYYEKICGNSSVIVNCIGHTHIDVAWLWTLAQTKEKAQRSFATVLELMRHYPEYRFMMSQPQLLKYVSEVDTEMYAEIKQLVKEGRFEVDGAMWLEADCNLISGESMVRQILHGKRFLKKEFDVDSRVLWLPDVFGYSAAMPQILKKSDISHFVTSKISWNDTNTMPYDTFVWQGIDGSEILANFITTQNYKKGGAFSNGTVYGGMISPTQVAGCWNRYQQKEYNNQVMLPYGWGDGGGGPTEDMLEQQRRLSYGLPGLPKTRMSSLSEHLENAQENFETSCRQIGKVPKWVGELYLEFHRGTYTSMACNKRFNRKSELMMQSLEFLGAVCSIINGKEFYKDELYSMWDIILLNQFHDILPGSSIREVYEDSAKQYGEIFEKGLKLTDEALSIIAQNIASNKGTLVYNSLGFDRSGIIKTGGMVYETETIPAYGWKVITPSIKNSRVTIREHIAENDFFALELDESGRIIKLYDKRNDREIIADNSVGNEIQIFEDIPPLSYENWEIEAYYKEKCMVLDSVADISLLNEGQRKGFKVVHKYHNSIITQSIYLYDSIERIDIENKIDWHEKRQLVKIAFPFNVHSNSADFDIQFGSVERNTHSNTSWDAAKFEVCAHKWVDISEFDYGISLLNDCKYGFNVEESTIKLTAIKCGLFPNRDADQGLHEFSYSIYTHKGDFRRGNTVKEAYSFNQPLKYIEAETNGGMLPYEFSFVKSDKDNVIIDTVKQCEDDSGIIVRIYDAYNCKSNPKITFGITPKKVELCDLMENVISEIPIEDNSVNIRINNFEIITLKVSF